LGGWGSAGCEGEHRVKPRIDDDRDGSNQMKLLPPIQDSRETKETPELASHQHPVRLASS